MQDSPKTAPSLEDAILLASQAHRGQRDKAGAPYILHPLRVMLHMSVDMEMMASPIVETL